MDTLFTSNPGFHSAFERAHVFSLRSSGLVTKIAVVSSVFMLPLIISFKIEGGGFETS